MSISNIIRARLDVQGLRYFANDNISSVIEPEELADLQREVEVQMEGVLRALVIDVDNDHNSKDTAKRVAKMLVQETYSGRFKPKPSVTKFPNDKNLDEMYTVGPIAVRSTCSHHMMPVLGSCWVGVIPGNNVIGLSKFNRLVDWVCTRPQIQEEATVQIADLLQEELETENLAVVFSASHGCMTCRGVKDKDTVMNTSVMRGVFREDNAARAEFMSLIKG